MGGNDQKLVQSNSPNDELSNDTPHDYGTRKNKIRGFRALGPYLGASIGGSEGSDIFFNHSTTFFTCRASKRVVVLSQPTFGSPKLSPVSFP
jgi:hypothetical protein